MLKTNAFLNRFLLDFVSFCLRKWSENSMFFGALSKKLILWKSLFSSRKIAIFLVLSFQKSIKFRCQNAFENDIEKKGSQIEFGHRFGLPKTTKIAPKSDAERSLFRDAMQTARKSCEGGGAQNFATVSLVLHRIRSAWSAPRHPNPQCRFLEIIALWPHFVCLWGAESSKFDHSEPKLCFRRPKIDQSRGPRASKSIPKASQMQ